MYGPASNDSYIRVTGTAAGSTVALARPGNWNSITIGTATTGTVTFYDSSTTAGTAAGNQIIVYTGAVVNHRPEIAVKNGLTVQFGAGTIDCLLGIG